MDIYLGPPVAAGGTAGLANVQVEVDTRYHSDWAFKGEPQTVSKAIRLKYRYPVLDAPGGTVLYWIVDYLLIGYEGSAG